METIAVLIRIIVVLTWGYFADEPTKDVAVRTSGGTFRKWDNKRGDGVKTCFQRQKNQSVRLQSR